MAPDPELRASRRGWPMRTQEATTSAGTHDHGLPQGIFRVIIALAVFLIVLAVVDAVLVIYIIGRGQLREQQIEQTREDVRDQLCEVLDGLPQGGVLDLTRDKLGCGPGLPLSSFSPEVQRQLNPTPQPPAKPAAPPPSAAPAPAPEPPAQPPAPDTPASPPGGADGPMAPAEPPPMSPPSQVRQLVCDLLPICPEGAS